MAEAKTKPTTTHPDDFIASVRDPARRADAAALVPIFQRATGEKPVMWGPSIIGFGKYHYRYESGREGDMCLAGFSPRSAALVLYVLTGSKDEAGLLSRLGTFKLGKGCLHLKRLADVDLKVLEDLVRRGAAHTRKVKQSDICVESRAARKAARTRKAAAKSAAAAPARPEKPSSTSGRKRGRSPAPEARSTLR
jgi:hypothetical protein